MKTVDVEHIKSLLPTFEGNRKVLVRRQDTYDIMREILNEHNDMRQYYDRIAAQYWSNNLPDTCKTLWHFCKNNVAYRIESQKAQSVKTPSAILGEAMGDCKHYASFIVGVLEALKRRGVPVQAFYRFSSYNPSRRTPQHVFAVVKNGNQEIWVDPVLTSYNQKKPYFFHIDKQPAGTTMSGIGELYQVSGTEDEMGSLFSLAKRLNPAYNLYHSLHHKRKPVFHPPVPMAVSGDTPAAHHHHHSLMMRDPRYRMLMNEGMMHTVHAVGDDGVTIGRAPKTKKPKKKGGGFFKKVGKAIKKIKPGKLLVKVGGAPSRNAFLMLMKVNAFQIARHLAEKGQNPAARDKIKKFWEKAGGKWTALAKNINIGVKGYNKRHHKNIHTISGMYQEFGDIGYADIGQAGIAAFIAAATPMLIAVKKLLGSMGVHVNTDNAAEASDEGTAAWADGHNNSDGGTHDDGAESEVVDNADGTQTLRIKKLGKGMNPEEEGGGEDTLIPPSRGGSGVTATSTDVSTTGDQDTDTNASVVSSTMAKIKGFLVEHKKPILIGAGVLALVFIVPKLIPKSTGRKRK